MWHLSSYVLCMASWETLETWIILLEFWLEQPSIITNYIHMQQWKINKCFTAMHLHACMHTWSWSIWVLREPFLVEEHCTGTVWPLVSEHSHFHTTGHPLVNKIHYLSYSDHRLISLFYYYFPLKPYFYTSNKYSAINLIYCTECV